MPTIIRCCCFISLHIIFSLSPHCPFLPALLPDLGQHQGAAAAGQPLRLPHCPHHSGIREARPTAAADICYQNKEKTTVSLINTLQSL